MRRILPTLPRWGLVACGCTPPHLVATDIDETLTTSIDPVTRG